MNLSEQTDALKARVYDLTLVFVQKYVHRYYKQYQGELEDLAMDYYIEFLTPKSRKRGEEESLLDKYDSSVTSLEYLVKVAVQRKLIDSSRQDTNRMLSVEQFTEQFGDCISEAFNLSTDKDFEESVDNVQFDEKNVQGVMKAFNKLNASAKKNIEKQFEELKSVLAPEYRALLNRVLSTSNTESFVSKYGNDIKEIFDFVIIDSFKEPNTPEYEPDVDSILYGFDLKEIQAAFAEYTADAKQAIKSYFLSKFGKSASYDMIITKILGTAKKHVTVSDMIVSLVTPDGLQECKCQQITDKTICVLYNGSVFDFHRESGISRNKLNPLKVAEASVKYIADNVKTFKSGFSRKEFIIANA